MVSAAAQKTVESQCEEPVFLVGCPRSGTTLLQRMLDAHSVIAIAPETHFVRRFWLKRDRYGDLTIDGNYRCLVDDIIAMPEFAEMGLDACTFRDAAMAQPRAYSNLFRLLLSLFSGVRRASVVGEKTPNHLLYVPTIEEFFPNARFIHIVRDPRAVVNSWRGVPWSTGWVPGDAMVWRRYMAAARRRPPRDASRLLTIRYEHLVLEPRQTLDRICRFIGVEYEPAMCDFHQTSPETVNIIREPWKANVAGPIDPSRLEAWRETLGKKMVARIEGVAWREMKRLAYQPQTPRWRLRLAAPLLWIGEAARHIKKKAGHLTK